MAIVAGGAFAVAAVTTASAMAWPGSASATPAQLTSVTQPQIVVSSQEIRDQQTLRAYQIGQAEAQQAAAAKKKAAEEAAKKAKEAAKKAEEATQAAAKKQAAKQAQAEDSGTPQQIAEAMLSQFGWSSSQFSCLEPLWERESGWSVSAYNAGSGAYGIPQALPGSKMASAGPDWQTSASTQIKWGLEYIQEDYGSPCGAWSHEEADGWY
jgi:hypothetical protein